MIALLHNFGPNRFILCINCKFLLLIWCNFQRFPYDSFLRESRWWLMVMIFGDWWSSLVVIIGGDHYWLQLLLVIIIGDHYYWWVIIGDQMFCNPGNDWSLALSDDSSQEGNFGRLVLIAIAFILYQLCLWIVLVFVFFLLVVFLFNVLFYTLFLFGAHYLYSIHRAGQSC